MNISHYELLQPIGRDGASEIHRARDLRLDREVAVKLLRREEMKRPGAVEQFKREARIASLVTHPHICAVHESGEDDGLPFLVCELLEGKALDELMAGAPLPPDRVLDIASQLAEALSAAHRRNIVHGNLKPSNVFITTDGHVKLLELGSGSTLGPLEPDDSGLDSSSPTAAIAVPATPPAAGELIHPYLSPEQITGAGTDERSDIFAMGSLLYEMASGKRAFEGDSPATIAAAITTQEPQRARIENRALARGIEPTVKRALQKDRRQRQQSAAELLDELRAARRALDMPRGVPGVWRSRQAAVAAAALAAVAIAAIGLTALARGWWGLDTAAAVERNTVLVSHIANGTADPDFDGTLREAVTVYLGQSPYLELVSDDRIRSTLQLMGRDPAVRMTHEIAAEVCQRLGLQAMLEGSVSAVGRAIVVALVATDCTSGATIARQQMEVERKEDVLRAIGPLSESLRTALGESRASLAQHNVPIEEATTPSIDALKAFTEGAARRASGAELDAIPFLERAITLDPRFALAHTTLSTLYGNLGESGRSEEYARRAYDNRGHVSERERLFIAYQYHDRATGDQLKARDSLEVWKRTYPRDYRPANALAVLLNRLGDYDAAVAEAEEAIRRNPSHAFPPSNLAHAHRGAGRYAQARAIAEQTVARGIETMPTRRLLYQLAEIDGDQARAQAQLQWAAHNPRGFDIVGARAQVEAFRGHVADARRFYAETIAAARQQGLTQVASGYEAQAALTEALYGYEREAVQLGRRTVSSSTAFEPQLRAAAALALAGAPDGAEVVVRRLRNVRPEDTLLHAAYLPVAEAAVLLRRGRSAEAIEQLRPAARYERGFVAALAPAYLRGEARLRAGAFAEAARDFQIVLGHRGAEPFAAVIPLSQLGLARALARSGQVAASREAYAALLTMWSSADPDLPVLQRARDEQSALR